jgi:hypothetical protein
MTAPKVLGALALLALTSCALRPRYNELLVLTQAPPPEGEQLKLQLTNRDTHEPLAGVKLELSEGKNRINAVTEPDGTFSLPVAKKYRDENPLLVVSLPAGIAGYDVGLAPMTLPPPLPPPESPPAEPANPAPASDSPPSSGR